ncbi:hypothetical protein ACXYMU_15225 [Pontibacter sp. CAU 1760]
MHQFLPRNAADRLQDFAAKASLQQEQLREAFSLSVDTVTEFLKRQLEKGNWEAVKEILHGKPMTKAGKFLLLELKSSLITKLIFRLGLRKLIAVGLVLVILPLVLAKVAGNFAAKSQ